MTIRQLSIFVENKPGKIAAVTKLLADAGIDLRALSVADTQDFGVLRLIADDTEKAIALLKEAGYVVSGTEIAAVRVPDLPGALSALLEAMNGDGVNLEYMYPIFTKERDYCYMALRVEDVAAAVKRLQEHGYQMAAPEDLGLK